MVFALAGCGSNSPKEPVGSVMSQEELTERFYIGNIFMESVPSVATFYYDLQSIGDKSGNISDALTTQSLTPLALTSWSGPDSLGWYTLLSGSDDLISTKDSLMMRYLAKSRTVQLTVEDYYDDELEQTTNFSYVKSKDGKYSVNVLAIVEEQYRKEIESARIIFTNVLINSGTGRYRLFMTPTGGNEVELMDLTVTENPADDSDHLLQGWYRNTFDGEQVTFNIAGTFYLRSRKR